MFRLINVAFIRPYIKQNKTNKQIKETKKYRWDLYFGISYFRAGSADVMQYIGIMQIKYKKCVHKI
jgi:hypothetical protein